MKNFKFFTDSYVSNIFWHKEVQAVAEWIKEKAHVSVKTRIVNENDMKREMMRIILNSKYEFPYSSTLQATLESDSFASEDLDFDTVMDQVLGLPRGDIVFIVNSLFVTQSKNLDDAYPNKVSLMGLPPSLFGA